MIVYASLIGFFILIFLFLVNCVIPLFRNKLSNGFKLFFDYLLTGDDAEPSRMRDGLTNAATYIAGVIVLIFFISLFLSVALPYALSEDENKLTGPLGDLFNGILTPILTSLTFFGLLITILMQRIDMKASLKELALTRAQYSEASMALNLQVKNSELQKFDSNFYSLLDHHNKVIKDFCDRKGGKVYFEKFSGEYLASTAWDDNRDEMLPIFLINYQLLKFIHANEKTILDFESAKKYSNIIRSLIPNNILFLLFYNANNFEGYRCFFERYEFFEHLSFYGVSNKAFLRASSNYNIAAFGDKVRLKKHLLSLDGVIKFYNFFAYKEVEYNSLLNIIDLDIDSGTLSEDLKKKFESAKFEIYRYYSKLVNGYHITENNIGFRAYVTNNLDYFIEKSDEMFSAYTEYMNEVSKIKNKYQLTLDKFESLSANN